MFFLTTSRKRRFWRLPGFKEESTETKYATGQAVLVPAIIRNAREENGVIVYTVDYDNYAIREDDIVLDDRANAIAFQREMERFNREIWR